MNTIWAPPVTGSSASAQTASFGYRLAAMGIDLLVLTGIVFLTFVAVTLMTDPGVRDELTDIGRVRSLDYAEQVIDADPEIDAVATKAFVLMAVEVVAYWPICASPLARGRTIGNLVLGLRVIRDTPRE